MSGFLKLGYRQLRATMWVLGTNLGALQEQKVLLAIEPSLQSLHVALLK